VLPDALPDIDELADADLLKFEKELLGFYISSHPLTEHQIAIQHFSTSSTKDAANCSEGTEVTIGGMINPREKDRREKRSLGRHADGDDHARRSGRADRRRPLRRHIRRHS